ncbi:replication initiation and membrane attachment family protein [Jeotgalibacillus sp. R-1-5s-1]|uniref:replication initiation and membrane attachment family protein n=1 Tax=Jeotgalibacillus sp. R-1-5s-1 TaxID=2555897 RepID=UPI00106C6A19|nr:DnaD domain protein [Jeotgalibacillus sp. R-1-5s-1]TFD92478.1 Replication initiation and membrane attachment protein [Jeotgalibacillus sp. R-1-5s-1]
MTNRWKEIQPSDEYKVQLNGQLNSHDREILTFLYQPLVGPAAVSLYNLLWMEVDKNQLESSGYSHGSLMAMLSFSIDEVFQARMRLEGMGLLKTYRHGTADRKSYLYQLQPPLSARLFFEDPMLSVFLYKQIGSTQFQRLKKYFSVPFESLDGYTEITRSFQDVFESDMKLSPVKAEAPDKNTTVVYRAENDGVPADFQGFDFQLLLAGLSEAMIPRKALTYEVKQMIVKLSVLYGLSETDMKNPILSALNEEDRVDVHELRKACRDVFQLRNKGTLPGIKAKTAENTAHEPVEELNTEDSLLHYLKTTSPVKVLSDASKGVDPTRSELELIETLLYEKKLPQEVVNVLLQFVLLRTNMKLTKGFAEQIANHWVRSGIQTAEAAMDEAKKEYKSYMTWKKSGGKQPAKKGKTIRKEKLPDWFTSKADSEEDEADPEFLKERERYLKEREMKKRMAGDE